MKNFLPYEYTLWLKRTALAHSGDLKIQTTTSSLISQLALVQSFDDLEELLNSSLSHPAALYTPMTLNLQLTEWQGYLANLKANYELAKMSLQESELTTHFPAFGMLLNELMTSPKAIIHSQFRSIIAVLQHQRFPELSKYLAQLEKSPEESSIARSGSFSSIMPINPEHQACLHLLNKLSANFDERNELYQISNKLIQTTLIVYQDLNFEEIDLNDVEETAKEKESNIFVDLYHELTGQDHNDSKKCTIQ